MGKGETLALLYYLPPCSSPTPSIPLPSLRAVTTTGFAYINKQPYYNLGEITLIQDTQHIITVFIFLKVNFPEFTGTYLGLFFLLIFLSFAKFVCVSNFFPYLKVM